MIPQKIMLGSHYNKPLSCIIKNDEKSNGYVLGFKIPDFQRPLVWTQKQKIKLIESLWCGIPIGAYTVNEFYGSEYDLALIDGQQRLNAIEAYIHDEFIVYNMPYSELPITEKRRFNSSLFPQYVTKTGDIDYLKNYYNLMNFGGTVHKESEKE